MATIEDIATLRRYINEPTQDPYTDIALSTLIDAGTSVRSVAADIWREKSAKYSELVDTTEEGSSRKLSQLLSNAQKMADFFDEEATVEVAESSSRARTRSITRL